MNSLFIVTSALHTKHGIYSSEERLNQTLETLYSVRKHLPDARILLCECSGKKGISGAEAEQLKPHVNGLFNYHDDKQVQDIYNSTDNWDIVKSYTELTVFGKTLDFILNQQPHLLNGIDRVFKLSGRYRLNDAFNIDQFAGDNYIFANRRNSQFPPQVTNGLGEQLMSRLWSWPANRTSLVFYRYTLMNEDFVGSINRGHYRDIEHLLFKYFSGPFLQEIPTIGVEGNLGPNGILVQD